MLALAYIRRQYTIYHVSNYVYTFFFWLTFFFCFFPEQIAQCLYWVGLGTLSAIGIGSGVPTGALYLFPYVSDLATTMPLMSCIAHALLPTLYWGFGTALGECPPYVMAATIQSRPEIVRMKQEMLPYLSKYGVWGVFAMACYPNMTFDACGIVCGLIDMPFWHFFLATMSGKTFVKAPLQALMVVFVSRGLLQHSIHLQVPPFVVGLFQYTSMALLVYFGGMCVHDLSKKEQVLRNQ